MRTKFVFIIYIVLFFVKSGFAEQINLLKIRVDEFKKELDLTDEQAENIYNILQEEEKYRKTKVYGYDATQTIEENIQMEKEENKHILNKIKESLTEEQYQQYLVIRSKSIRNELTLYLKKELNLNYKQLAELDGIIQILYHELELLKPEDNINKIPDKSKTEKNKQEAESLFVILEKELIEKLNDIQLKDFQKNKIEINTYIKREIVKFKESNKDEGDNRQKQGQGGKGGPPPQGIR